jgi:hypothetical protein
VSSKDHNIEFESTEDVEEEADIDFQVPDEDALDDAAVLVQIR